MVYYVYSPLILSVTTGPQTSSSFQKIIFLQIGKFVINIRVTALTLSLNSYLDEMDQNLL